MVLLHRTAPCLVFSQPSRQTDSSQGKAVQGQAFRMARPEEHQGQGGPHHDPQAAEARRAGQADCLPRRRAAGGLEADRALPSKIPFLLGLFRIDLQPGAR